MTGENICSCEWCEEIKVGMDAVVYKDKSDKKYRGCIGEGRDWRQGDELESCYRYPTEG